MSDAQDDRGSMLERMFTRFGFPTALSLVLLAFVGYTANTFYNDFLKPQADAHMRLVGSLEKAMADQQETNRGMQRALEELSKTQQQIVLRLELIQPQKREAQP